MAAITRFSYPSVEVTQSYRDAVPVLAFGCELTLMGVTRIFGRNKIPHYTICDKGDFARQSRWYSEPPVKVENLRPHELALFLRSLDLERAVLMPCTDDWLHAVSSLPPALAKRFPASVASSSVIETLIDKWRFAQLLEKICVPHPPTLCVASRDQLANLPENCFTSKILKPLSSIEFARKHRVKGFLVQNRGEALHFSQSIDFPILLQHFIPGPPTANVFVEGFVDRHGRICARMARQRLRMFPPNLGNSTLSRTIPLADVTEAVNSIDRVFSSVPYRGIFSAEFKYDRRDGHFKILEINARPWWYVEFAASCGMDLCQLAYLDALDLPVNPIHDYQVNRRCVFLPNDLRAFLGSRRRGDSLLGSWLQSWSGASGALMAWDDPRPAIACALGAGRSALAKYISKQVQ